jgi:hypothetical protein
MARYTTQTLQNAQAGNNDGFALAGLEGNASVIVIAKAAAFTGTVNWEVSEDGVTWFAVMATPLDTGTKASTAAYAGAVTNQKAFAVPTLGVRQFRARTSAVSAGSITITARPSDVTVYS